MTHSVPGRVPASRAIGVGLAAALLSGCAATTSTNPPRDSSVALIPALFHGTWAADETACSAISHESRLTIRADAVDFYESRGKLLEVTSSSSARPLITVRLQLTGEGSTWESTREFKLSPDGNKLETGGSLRVRCR